MMEVVLLGSKNLVKSVELRGFYREIWEIKGL